jgi:Ca2+:H+ antiporter
MQARQRLALGLLVMLPLSAAADRFGWGDGVVFFTAILSIIPLAIWLSTATEELSIRLGPSIGALLNALFGNATELIIALVALRAGLVDIVKASITGTVMANLLLALGLSMLAGGIGRWEQRFQPVVARVNGSAMTLALLAILIPSLRGMVGGEAGGLDPAAAQSFSVFVAWVLLIVYGLTLLFSLGTHRTLYEVAEVDLLEGEDGSAPRRCCPGSPCCWRPPLDWPMPPNCSSVSWSRSPKRPVSRRCSPAWSCFPSWAGRPSTSRP